MGPPKRFKLKTNVLFAKKDLLTQLLYLNPIRTDDFLFRVHYKLSVFILLMVYLTYSRILYKFGILSCIFSNGSNNDGLNSACFALSVYSIDFNEDQMPRINDAYQGKGASISKNPGVIGFASEEGIRENVAYHKYYQFTPFILLIQIIIFVSPRYVWRCFEDGKIAMLCKGLDNPLEQKKDKVIQKKTQVAEYFVACLHTNNPYAFVYVGCELMNMLGVVFQLYFLDAATSNVFSTHGFQSLSYILDGYKKNDPFSVGFPTLAKCTVNQYGAGGNIVPHSGVCTLPLNVVTKGYIAWFWMYLVVLTLLSGISISYRIATMLSFNLREGSIKDYSIVRKEDLSQVMKNCAYGDWFILKLLAENLDTFVFNEILAEVVTRLQEPKPEERVVIRKL